MSVDKERIRKAVKEILFAIGEDPEREGLLQTPDRVARMCEEIFGGLDENPDDHLKVFDENHSEMVLVREIPLYSICEHHLVPFIGKANIAYIPNGKLLGLSKLARITNTFARRPQLQERLTSQIADYIFEKINSLGVAVYIECEHLCMTMRGAKAPGSLTATSALRGIMRTEAKTRAEAMMLLTRK